MAVQHTIGGSYKKSFGKAQRRLICAIDGMEKEGKSHFALTMPGPIAYQGLDIGIEGVVEKFQDQKEIWIAEYDLGVEKNDNQAQIMAKAGPVWDSFSTDFKDVTVKQMSQLQIRSAVWDTGSDIWELQRLARLGKLTQVMPHHYTALNSEYQNLVREIFKTGGNMCILHKLKAEWKDNPLTGKGNKTGQYERSGFAGTGFLVQVNARCWRDKEGEFHLTVENCRQNPSIAGLDLSGQMCSFPWLGVHVYPDTDLDYWT
jgi:hypothetical protein